MKQPGRAQRLKKASTSAVRSVRADAQRNLDALLEAAKAVFGASGVDAPVRDIATRAGVGIATVFRHFPQRSDLKFTSSIAHASSCFLPSIRLRHSLRMSWR